MRSNGNASRKALVGIAAGALLCRTLALLTLPDFDGAAAAVEVAVHVVDCVLGAMEADILSLAVPDVLGAVNVDRLGHGDAVSFAEQGDGA